MWGAWQQAVWGSSVHCSVIRTSNFAGILQNVCFPSGGKLLPGWSECLALLMENNYTPKRTWLSRVPRPELPSPISKFCINLRNREISIQLRICAEGALALALTPGTWLSCGSCVKIRCLGMHHCRCVLPPCCYEARADGGCHHGQERTQSGNFAGEIFRPLFCSLALCRDLLPPAHSCIG